MKTKNTSRNWVIASAVTAMLAASTAAVRAQDAATTPMQSNMTPMGTTGMMPGTEVDYSILSNRHYDYIDLQQAKARGLSDSQIATISKIAKEAYVPFNEVASAVERGDTFAMLATKYNLNLASVYDVDKEKMMIANYEAAYETTGSKGMMSGGAMLGSTDMSMASGSGTMTPAMPMAPTTTMPMASTTMPMATMDIVDTIAAAKNLSTLSKALQLAGLNETLKGAGPFTIFAPDNRAFSRLPAGQLDALMADPAKLKSILTYHVLPASVNSTAAMSMTSPTSPPTVEGGTLQVTRGRRGSLMINDATVTKADITASNGVVHIINRVLMPSDMTPMTPATPATP